MKIGELAKATGLSTKPIRFYEAEGLEQELGGFDLPIDIPFVWKVYDLTHVGEEDAGENW